VRHALFRPSRPRRLGFRHGPVYPVRSIQVLFPLETVRIRDWEALEGRHSGGFVLDELQQIVQTRIDIELQRIQHMVSIVVPVLNEAHTLQEVLKSLLLLDFSRWASPKKSLLWTAAPPTLRAASPVLWALCGCSRRPRLPAAEPPCASVSRKRVEASSHSSRRPRV